MSLTSALTAQNLTDIRSGIYQVSQFVLSVPNTTVVQFQPSAAPSTTVFAEITVGAVASGDMANIEEGQTVIFSTSSSYQATETFRTRVRKVSGTTILYVGENSTTLTTSNYITVLDTYEVQERLRKSTTLVDWDITFRKLRPIETALASAYVLTNDDVTWSETASPVVMDADAASISTHAWSSSNSNDTLDSGGTTATPSFTLEANSFRWLRYTFTDDLGLSNYRVIPVWTVGKDYSNPYILGVASESGDMASISFDAELGWTCDIPAYSGISSLLKRSMICVACDEWYGGTANANRQSIRTNVNFIGYLQSESTNTNADENYGRVSTTNFTIEGFGHQLDRQNMSEVTIIQTKTSATAWDKIQDPTPGRMLTYRLTEYSTASTLMAIKIPSDDTSFIGDDITLDTGKCLEDLRFIGDTINAEIQFDIHGILELVRDLNFLDSTARDAAPVVATLTPADFVGGYSLEYEYGYLTSQVTVTAGTYDSTSDSYDLFEAITPAEARYVEGDPFVLANQVLTTDNSASASITEIAQRAANFLAANNSTWILRARVSDAWLPVCIPDAGNWWKFTIAATDTTRGKTFGSSDRWQLQQVDYTTNSVTGAREGDCVWRLETESTGASVRARPIVNDPDADIDYLPAFDAPYLGTDQNDTGGNWYDSYDPQPPSEPTPAEVGCENGGFRPKTGSGYTTSTPALNGEDVAITVRGSGVILQGQDDSASVNAVTNPHAGGGATSITVSSGEVVTFTATGTWSYDSGATVVDADGTVGYTLGTSSLPSADIGKLIGKVGSGGSWFAIGVSNTIAMPATGTLYLAMNDIPDHSDNTGSVSVDISSPSVTGDAFYEIDSDGNASAYGAGDGLLLAGSQLNYPPYDPSSEYVIYDNLTSGVLVYTWGAPYPLSQHDNWNLQIETCFLGVP